MERDVIEPEAWECVERGILFLPLKLYKRKDVAKEVLEQYGEKRSRTWTGAYCRDR